MDVIWNFLSHIDFESASNFMSEASKHSIVDWTMKIGIVWMIMGRKVSARFEEFENRLATHFKEIEGSFGNMVGELKELKENVSTEIGNVKTRVEKLENTKE